MLKLNEFFLGDFGDLGGRGSLSVGLDDDQVGRGVFGSEPLQQRLAPVLDLEFGFPLRSSSGEGEQDHGSPQQRRHALIVDGRLVRVRFRDQEGSGKSFLAEDLDGFLAALDGCNPSSKRLFQTLSNVGTVFLVTREIEREKRTYP